MKPLALVAAVLIICCMPLPAERYAVLVGIGSYAVDGMDLEGPAHDIEVLETTLRRMYSYAESNVTVLLNQSATKRNIVAALEHRVAQLRTNDELLFYFSGHGTSAYDRNAKPVASYIGPDSGALAPYDLSLSSPAAAAESLLIGRRDLRPILSRVPSGARALVILDACYSENATRTYGSLASAPVRGISLSSLLPMRNAGTGSTAGAPVEGTSSGPGSGEPYPYSNVIALAAASRQQPALDLNARLIKRGNRTFDGRPHGAFTNSLMRALNGEADTNRDGVMTYDELYRFIRRDMERFPQTPQMLVPAGMPVSIPALGASGISHEREPAATPVSKTRGIRIRLEGVPDSLAHLLVQIENVRIAETEYSLLLRQTRTARDLLDRSGILIRSYSLDDLEPLLARIRGEATLSELLGWRYASQPFNVQLDVQPVGAQGYDRYRPVFRVGEPVSVRIGAERAAWLLLLNIDKRGLISVLYPGAAASEQQMHRAGQMVDIQGLRVLAPAGSDHLKLFAFTSMPPDWSRWLCSMKTENGRRWLDCPELPPGDPRMYDLLNMIRAAEGSAGETGLRVITNE